MKSMNENMNKAEIRFTVSSAARLLKSKGGKSPGTLAREQKQNGCPAKKIPDNPNISKFIARHGLCQRIPRRAPGQTHFKDF